MADKIPGIDGLPLIGMIHKFVGVAAAGEFDRRLESIWVIV
jgi:hypothetical protein